jgi:hypothetical protein
MNALLPDLARTAGYVAILGVGVEFLVGDSKGMIFVSLVVGAVAIHALAFYAGIGIAIGVPIGVFMGLNACMGTWFERFRVAVGGAIVGGFIGHFGIMTLIAIGEASMERRLQLGKLPWREGAFVRITDSENFFKK